MANDLMNVKSGNPGLNDRTFNGLPRPALASERMTLQGTINKSFLALIVLIRTGLSFSLQVEIDGVAPWRRALVTGPQLLAKAVRSGTVPTP